MKNNLFSAKNDKPLQEEKKKRKFRSRIHVEGIEQLSDADLERVSGGINRPDCSVTPI